MSDRIPALAQLLAILTQARRYIDITTRFLRTYPDGKPPHGSTAPRDTAWQGLKRALERGQADAPYGWPAHVCVALAEMHRLAGDLGSWFTPLILLDEPAPEDRFNVAEESLALSRWVELMATVSGAVDQQLLEGEPPPGTARAATETTGRRSGQALTEGERKTYLHIIATARRLKLEHWARGNTRKIADAAKVDVETVEKAMKWGRRHKRM